jgi:hypothetical protein
MLDAATRAGDDACREWLAWRGFSATLRALDLESQSSPGLAVDRLTEQLLSGLDSRSLCSLLDFLRLGFFARLDLAWAADLRKLESSLLRLFVVRELQAGRRERVTELFEREADRLLSYGEDWQARLRGASLDPRLTPTAALVPAALLAQPRRRRALRAVLQQGVERDAGPVHEKSAVQRIRHTAAATGHLPLGEPQDRQEPGAALRRAAVRAGRAQST